MKTFKIETADAESTLLVGERIENAEVYLPGEKAVILTDTEVEKLYASRFPDFDVITIGTGEKIKTLETASYIYGKLVEAEADRSTFILGIGGGIVCDIAGFIASTYLRGVRFGFVSSTLLSQVDASVGGKNGVNYGGYKNMVGVFNQPEFVICDMNMLKTLPAQELRSGFAEAIKHGAIADFELIEFMEKNIDGCLGLDPGVIERLVFDSIRIKSDFVERDERETGERRKLNFGHTFGHAIEKTTGVTHGEAVSIGMGVAADLSVKRGLLDAADAVRLKKLISNLELPISITTDKTAIFDAMKRDKKREGDLIHFVLLKGLGSAVVEKISLDELAAVVF